MELRDYIEIGATKAGSLTALGKILGMSQPDMSHAKAHKIGITLAGAVKLADYINADRFAVIIANELATEKKEEKRAFWSQLLATPPESYIRHIKAWFIDRRQTYRGHERRQAVYQA